MNLNLKIVDREDQYSFSKIEEFGLQHEGANFLQSVKLFKFYETIELHTPFYVISEDDKGELKGILLGVIVKNKGFFGLKEYFSSRCIIEGGPLVIDNDADIISEMLITLDSYIKDKVIYSEFRNFFSFEKLKTVFSKNSWEYNEHLNFIVDINEMKEGKRKISRSKKTQINKSIKNGASIEIAQKEEDVLAFYKILDELYRTKVKKPLPDFDFFKRLFEMDSLFKYFLIKNNDQVIGGILCPIYKDTISEWYICGEDGKHKNIYPSVLATWAPIDYAMNNELSFFDFLGAGKPDEDYGVRDFKSKFGGDLVENGRFEKIHKPMHFKIAKFGLNILQKIS